MELKEFVKVTLEQIVDGVAAAEEAVAARGGTINPSSVQFQQNNTWTTYTHVMPQEVIFDVGLTSTGKGGSTEGIGVFLGSISLGKKNDSSKEEVAVTKVRFTVPLVLPPGRPLV